MSKSIDRLKTILYFVNKTNYPSLNKIINKLIDEGYVTCSERTVQRDFKSIRETCLIDVEYDRNKKGYYIDEESKKETEEWLSFFELFQTAKVINQTLLKSAENIEYIDFDRNKQIIQEQLLSGILNATVERKSVNFEYHNFRKNETTNYFFQPYLLKQYQNRWYVFGTINKDEFRTFALDRMFSLKNTNEKFKSISNKPKQFFDDVIGMIYSTSDVNDVVLSFSVHQGNYIKTQPLHTSQKILIDNEEEFRISLRVRINYELEEQILKQGEKVRVIEPEELKTVIKNRLIKALENY